MSVFSSLGNHLVLSDFEVSWGNFRFSRVDLGVLGRISPRRKFPAHLSTVGCRDGEHLGTNDRVGAGDCFEDVTGAGLGKLILPEGGVASPDQVGGVYLELLIVKRLWRGYRIHSFRSNCGGAFG